MGDCAVFGEYLINLHTDPHTLQTDRESASWATNGHRQQHGSIQADAQLPERAKEEVV